MNSHAMLLIYAHPDDETVFTGGFIAQYAANGGEVYLISATRGECGTTSGLCTQEGLGVKREEELREAAKVLGIKEIIFLDYRDKELRNADEDEITHRIAEIIRRIRPESVITFGPDGATGHEDHKAIHKFAMEAMRIAGDLEEVQLRNKPFMVPTIYYVTLPLKIRESWGFDEEAFEPDTIIDVKAFSKTKMKALFCHKTQGASFKPFFNVEGELLQGFMEQETFRLAKENDVKQQC